MSDIIITTPVDKTTLRSLRAGDDVLLTGTIYTARDAAHERFTALINNNKKLPISLENQILFYCGPTPPPPNRCIGSAGPTTSSRMDKYTPNILQKTGLAAMIGKGNRSDDVIESIKQNGAVYFAAIGGAGALLSQCIKSAKTVCYEDLGAEAVYQFDVENFPLIVAIDTLGDNLYNKKRKLTDDVR
ncbi:MAG: Fe-S-containing hydro-lyase [Chitinispirillales bacterium]|jgi:fumarate hydratase subunit beta|nr:Fe-S-containing hydro-lyase [Chitinispirillales bacterium]